MESFVLLLLHNFEKIKEKVVRIGFIEVLTACE